MLQRVRERLVLILLVLLPFHALLVTVGTRLLVGAGHAPLPWLAGWKEAILALVLLLAFVEVVLNEKLSMDILDWLILGLFALSVLVPNTYPSATSSGPSGKLTITYLYGFKYTLFPLLLFLILRRVPWSERFLLLTSYFLLLVGGIVAGYGILTLFLPEPFFTWLGYSDLHSLYLPDGPIAAFQMLEGTGIRRMQSTLSGPNQLGMWLLIPWSVVLSALVRKAPHPPPVPNGYVRAGNPLPLGEGSMLFLWILQSIALFFTFSRAAWVGAAVIIFVVLMQRVSAKTTRCRPVKAAWRPTCRFTRLLVAGCSFLVFLLFVGAATRPRSTAEHLRRPLEALQVIAAHPLGLGLGSAGPAANRTSDPCVFLPPGADASWASDRTNLCVFVGDQQVKPVGRPCACPLLPENWYLQVGVELGVLGLILFVTLVALLLRSLPIHYPLLTFLGISVAALFLHAWEDAAVAYTVWILLAIEVPFLNGAWIHRRS